MLDWNSINYDEVVSSILMTTECGRPLVVNSNRFKIPLAEGNVSTIWFNVHDCHCRCWKSHIAPVHTSQNCLQGWDSSVTSFAEKKWLIYSVNLLEFSLLTCESNRTWAIETAFASARLGHRNLHGESAVLVCTCAYFNSMTSCC